MSKKFRLKEYPHSEPKEVGDMWELRGDFFGTAYTLEQLVEHYAPSADFKNVKKDIRKLGKSNGSSAVRAMLMLAQKLHGVLTHTTYNSLLKSIRQVRDVVDDHHFDLRDRGYGIEKHADYKNSFWHDMTAAMLDGKRTK